jgi:hypothetical protein
MSEKLSYGQADDQLNCSPRAERIFPPPWRAEEFSDGYCVLDANNCVLAYVVAGEQIADAAERNGLTLQEASRIARVIAGLPDLIPDIPAHQPHGSWSKWLNPREFYATFRNVHRAGQPS